MDPRSTLAIPLDRLPSPLPIEPVRVPFRVVVRPPGSKSLTNRALVLASLAGGTSVLRRALVDAQDAEVMLSAVERLGARVERTDDELRIEGVGGRWSVGRDGVGLNLANAGTATRFLAATVLLSPGPMRIDGNDRMRQRPIAELVDGLLQLGVSARYLGKPGCPPVLLGPPTPPPTEPATVRVSTTASSQFLSALLLVAPWLPAGLTLRTSGSLTSRSYVAMTLGLLERLGATVRTSEDLALIRVGPAAIDAPAPLDHPRVAPPRGLPPFDLEIEPDASGATYFWAAAALVPGAAATVNGLSRASLQGDAAFPDVLARMGAEVDEIAERGVEVLRCRGAASLSGITADMASMPDAAVTLAVVAALAKGRSVIHGVRTLRVKECDRVAALRVELSRIGVRVEEDGDDTIVVTPPDAGIDRSPDAPPVVFDTYEDHRMAMALSLVGLVRPNVMVRDPACVAKTYPRFWLEFGRLYG